ncbi:MAG: transcription termination/antitermination protein NusG [Candidatus Colwellbacteria bacterium CG10_big_fil_rev_8_21_14_0_10_41_28]|uniref:Transcription termination/antitermination protein NusG n=1 Tax=Candidatus Colwellbacteria bacterium CG10_big_fil_rev_8_21_14_0_10_41_28 TaxID=1974539 RepID=A0A2H0VHK2_9BACT|nr:MAG: transcription termination/antitermination protein NusG [Candidatus Colwellbacteria bacterium CG10_big_fil_rev_8_21_14_0_10_41_28]
MTEDKRRVEQKKFPQWFAVHTYAGYEDAVKRYLEQRIESLAMNDKVFKMIVPKEKMIKIKNGKRTTIEEKIYPGYVLVNMIMEPDSWYVVRNTPRVTGFVGADATNPSPLSQDEINSLIARMGKDEPKLNLDISVGETIRITDGPFKDYDGKVSEIDEERGRVKVMVPVFGRDTAVELDSLQIKKI